MRRTIALFVAFIVCAALVQVAQPGAQAATNTFVSLTFDDGQASQYAVGSNLSSHGMTGTFYINSAMVGTSSYYMTWPQIHDLANAGNEIGGHTLHHTNLTSVSRTTATREACDDRTALTAQGFSPVSFAYPEAESNATAKQIVKGCGYTTARGVGDIYNVPECTDCPYAESIPPADAFSLRTPEGIESSTTLSALKSYVTNAETHGGGWIVLVFHGICDNQCTDVNSLSPSIFTPFLDWLQPRSALGTTVRTVGSLTGTVPPPGPDTTAPTTSIACNGAPCASWYRSPASVALAATDSGSGVAGTWYTTDGSDPATSATAVAYATPVSVSATTTVRYYSKDRSGNTEATKSQTIRIDAQAPSASITQPTNGASIRRRTVVSVTASAADTGTAGQPASGIARVAFYDGGSLLATDTTAPYGIQWNTRNGDIGTHTLTATATDLAGNSATSPPVRVTLTR